MKMQWILIMCFSVRSNYRGFCCRQCGTGTSELHVRHDIHAFDSRHFNIHLIRRSDCRSLRYGSSIQAAAESETTREAASGCLIPPAQPATSAS